MGAEASDISFVKLVCAVEGVRIMILLSQDAAKWALIVLCCLAICRGSALPLTEEPEPAADGIEEVGSDQRHETIPVELEHRHSSVAGSHIASPPGAFRVMPLGDSISICCNYCAVPAGVLIRKDLHEPPTPWDGYIRKLWHKLKSEERRQAALLPESESRFQFTYVGRVQSCMVNRSETMRVADDWEIRYEGYYGYTTGRVLSEVVVPALQANDPDVVLLMLGTNDLIQARAGGRQGRVGAAIQNLKALIDILLTTPRNDRTVADRSRHVIIAKIPPIWFGQIKAVAPGARKPHRVAALNREIEKVVTSLVEAQKSRFAQLQVASGGSPPRFIPSISFVDMQQNMSTTDDLHGDGLHPNHRGEEKISAEWYRGLGPMMANPGWYRGVPMAQNSDALLHDRLIASGIAGGSKPPLPSEGKRKRPSSMQEPSLFGERPSSSWDHALIPAVVFTITVYAFLVCRPTQRLGRHWTTIAVAAWSRMTTKPRAAPQ